MRRPTLNFLIDAAAFVGFVFLVSTGVLMRYVLPPGSGARSVVWGLDRHDWGALHFWISAAFLAVLAFHLVLHGRWILSVLRGRPRQGSGSRVALGLVGLMAVLAIGLAPLLSPVERVEGEGAGAGSSSTHELRGSMTLSDLERQTGVPASYVLRGLGLPPDLSREAPLGRLARQHGFQLDQVRRIVGAYEPAAGDRRR
jgi:hypothetical protein